MRSVLIRPGHARCAVLSRSFEKLQIANSELRFNGKKFHEFCGSCLVRAVAVVVQL